MVEEIRATLDKLNSLLISSGVSHYKLGVEAPQKLKLLEKNARFMKQEIFSVLVEGIKGKGLSQLPLCWFDGEKYLVISGNHRVQAAVSAGAKYILFLFTDEEMSREAQVSIQLAHNNVTGEDDPVILRELWDEINSPDLKFLTGFDDDFFEKLKPVEFMTIKEPPLLTKEVVIFFIQEDMDKLEEAEALIKRFEKKEQVMLAKYEDFEAFFLALVDLKAHEKIVNTATAIRKMAEITIEHLKSLEKEAEAVNG
jgi:hypothetical protein